MNAQRTCENLLRQHKFKLIVDRADHRQYKSPEGRILVTVRTPSDGRSWDRTLHDLKRVIASPVPIVSVLEVERQQQSLREFLAVRPAPIITKPTPARAARPSGQGSNKGTGITYIVKVLPVVTEADIELSKRAKAQDQIVHRANKDIRGLRHDFMQMAANEGRAWIERGVWKSAQRNYDMAATVFQKLNADGQQINESSRQAGEFKYELKSLDAGYQLMLAASLKQGLPGVLDSARKISRAFSFELDSTTASGWRRRFPNVIRETFVPENGIYIPVIYRRWLQNIVPPEDWAYFEERAEGPDAEWLQQVLAHTPPTQGTCVLTSSPA